MIAGIPIFLPAVVVEPPSNGIYYSERQIGLSYTMTHRGMRLIFARQILHFNAAKIGAGNPVQERRRDGEQDF